MVDDVLRDNERLRDLDYKVMREQDTASDLARWADKDLQEKAVKWADELGEWSQSLPLQEKVKDYILNQNAMYKGWYKELSGLKYGSGKLGPYERYQRLAGEAESRLVQARMDMTPEQLRAQYPYDPAYFEKATGVPLNELIIRGQNNEPMLMTAYHGSPHKLDPEKLVRLASGETAYVGGKYNALKEVPEGAVVLQDFPAGRFREAAVGTGEGAQAYGHGAAYLAEGEQIAKTYRIGADA
jgi:hypothetical protein